MRLRGDRCIDAVDLLGDVVVRIHLRDAHAPRLVVLLRLVDAPLEDRPELTGVAVRDDRDLDGACIDRAERRSRRAAKDGRPCGEHAALYEQVAPAEAVLLLQLDELGFAHVPLLSRLTISLPPFIHAAS